LPDPRQRIGMPTLRQGLALSLVVLVLGAAAPVTAKTKPTAAEKCTAAKLKASAKKLSAKLACYAKAAAKNAPVDDECIGKAETSFKTAFSTAESKGGCVPTGDAMAVEASIEAFVQSEVTALHGDGTKDGGKCASAKRKAAGKKAMAELLCNAKAVTKNVPVDPTCLGKAGANLGKAFTKAEKKGGCATSEDAITVGQAVDAVVAQVVTQLIPTATTSTTVTTTSTTSTATTPGSTTSTQGNTTSTTTGPQVHIVTVGPGGALTFDPATLPIHVGDTVKWMFDSPGHSVVSGTATMQPPSETPDGKFCSPSDTNCGTSQLSNAGDSYQHAFNTAGSFPYYCFPHGTLGMTGMITVTP
jgi:plastocyanin